MSDQQTFIYGLRCPIDGRIRYIGKTKNPANRLYRHLSNAARGCENQRSYEWIRELQRKGLRPSLEIIFTVPIAEDWRAHERRVIADARAKGWPLTNTAAGGAGVVFLDKRSAVAAKAARQAGFTERVRAQMSASIKAAWADPVKRARIVAAQKAAASTPARRDRLRIAGEIAGQRHAEKARLRKNFLG